jgi:hypothetical protein
MKQDNFIKYGICSILILFLIASNIYPSITAKPINSASNSEYDIDIDYVYNLTKALSNIIYTEYNVTTGEIPKGRAFGSKGERRAAQILEDNMTKLGLFVTMEQLHNIPQLPTITEKIDVLDYQLTIQTDSQEQEKIMDCYISPTYKGLRSNPDEININFSFHNLTLIEKPQVGHPLQYLRHITKYKQDFVFITQDDSYNPDLPTPPMKKLLSTIFSPYSDPVLFWNWFRYNLEISIWYTFFPHCQGLIRYDFHNNTYNMDYTTDWKLPVIFINGSQGQHLLSNIDTATIDFYLNQKINSSATSYNIIGQLNGSDTSKIIIIDSLYDSFWTQGTADSAIGMSIVLGIAKYLTDNNITPKYTIQFIGFSGEEYGFRGALYHEATHKNDNIQYLIDLNQLGFTQNDPPLYLELISNNHHLLNDANSIAHDLEYINHTGSAGVRTHFMPLGGPSNDQPFARNRFNCYTISLLKGLNWLYHHRTGMNYTEGDSIKYFNSTDVAITSQIVLELVKKLAL